MAGVKPWPCACAQGPTKNYEPASICCCTPTGMSTTASKQRQATTEGSRLTPHGLHPNLHNQDIDHRINGLQQGNLMICSLDQGKRPLRHDGDGDDLDMHNNGHVNNITKNGTCGNNRLVRAQLALCVPTCLCCQTETVN